jgi:hypothetical protein
MRRFSSDFPALDHEPKPMIPELRRGRRNRWLFFFAKCVFFATSRGETFGRGGAENLVARPGIR